MILDTNIVSIVAFSQSSCSASMYCLPCCNFLRSLYDNTWIYISQMKQRLLALESLYIALDCLVLIMSQLTF
jgi:hypothetical protein